MPIGHHLSRCARLIGVLQLALILAALPASSLAASHMSPHRGAVQSTQPQNLAPVVPRRGTGVMEFECKGGECSCNDFNEPGDCDNMRRLKVCVGKLECYRDHWGYEHCTCKMR